MLTTPTIDELDELKLSGMKCALEEQLSTPDIEEMTFDERLSLMIDREKTHRHDRALKRRLSQAKLRQQAAIEDITYRGRHGLTKKTMLSLASCNWIRDKHNVLITGPCGIGKSYIACALAHKACRDGYTTRYTRTSRLLEQVHIARADGTYERLLAKLAKIHVLILDDFGLTPLSAQQQRDLLELVEDRHDLRSTIVASQLPIDTWHDIIGEATIADAILDRLIHNAHHLTLQGDSMRKTTSQNTTDKT